MHDQPVLQEVRNGHLVATTGRGLSELVTAGANFLREAGIEKGERCVLLAHNSVHWAALDLALMARGIIAVPLYARQAPAELVAMMKDCQPSLICCGDASLRDAITQAWPDAPPRVLFDEMFAQPREDAGRQLPVELSPGDPATIIYTSGTSGEAKGVILTVGNLNHMLACATAHLDLLMGSPLAPDRVFHYLPLCFAGSWILLLTSLSRYSVLTLSTDLAKLADEMRLADPHYFLNVPTLLERMRTAIRDQLAKRGGLVLKVFQKGEAAWLRRRAGEARGSHAIWLGLANRMVFPAIRKKLGPNLKALICGSAPLAKETQLFFQMLGLPVLQVYGLTETTAICTMDDPRRVTAGCVGPAIDGIEMRLGEAEEILVRGPNIFPGYWNRSEETARVLRDGWFHTGDQGEVDSAGNWRIIGRLKNLIILNSGHNIAPEPIEERLLRQLLGAHQVVLLGNGRSFLSAIVTGQVSGEQVQAVLEAVNPELPHYKRIHAFHIEREPFTIESGLLTANGKLKRDAIAARFAAAIEELCREKVT